MAMLIPGQTRWILWYNKILQTYFGKYWKAIASQNQTINPLTYLTPLYLIYKLFSEKR